MIERVSCERGDPGEKHYAMLCADGEKVKITLDGIEQIFCLTADSANGWIKKFVVSPGGRMAFNPATQEPLTEVVHGDVQITTSPT